jgi:hypothetical protein
VSVIGLLAVDAAHKNKELNYIVILLLFSLTDYFCKRDILQ